MKGGHLTLTKAVLTITWLHITRWFSSGKVGGTYPGKKTEELLVGSQKTR